MLRLPSKSSASHVTSLPSKFRKFLSSWVLATNKIDCLINSRVESSILFEGVEVGRHAQLFRTILDKNVVVEPGARVGFDHDHDRARGLTVTEEGIAVAPKGLRIQP